jgi:hypothetical protein
MRIGSALAMIAAGAILHYAVTLQSSTINIQRTGTILLVVGIVALVISLWWVFWLSGADERKLGDY